MPQDDRTMPRHALVRRVSLRFPGVEEYLSSFSGNIGQGGMFVHTENPPLPGTKIVLTLAVDGLEGEISLPGVVAHTRSDGIGVRFESLTTHQREAIEELCRRATDRLKAIGGVNPTLLKLEGQAESRSAELRLLQAGTLVDGRYRVLAHLASGGMGEVYQAEHVYMRRTIALKVLHPEFGNDPEMAARFEREAQIASSLDHPNIVRVFDFGKTSDGKLFLAMELVAGEELEDLLVREGALTPARTVSLMSQICEAVEDAHAHGIIHRDLKLANIIVTRRKEAGGSADRRAEAEGPEPSRELDGSSVQRTEAAGGEKASFDEIPKVLDFGIARLADDATTGPRSMTRRGIVVGTPEYLSPEQALGQPIDARSDVYSLGIMAYTLLAGRLPFFSENVRHVVTMQLTQAPPPLEGVVPALRGYPAICAAVMRALAKEREQRFPGAAAFGRALHDGLSGRTLPIAASVALPPVKNEPRAREEASGVSPPANPAGSAEEVAAQLPCSRCGARVLLSERFCSACGTPVAPPCPRCQSPTSTGARFCPSCGLEFSATAAAHPSARRTGPPPGASDLGSSRAEHSATLPPPKPVEKSLERLQEIARFLPPRAFDAMVGAREQLRGEERRYVTALWAEIGPIPGGEPASETRLRVLAAALEAAHENGGVVQLVGESGVLAFFGALSPREDDAYRALTAALDIPRRAKALDLAAGASVRVGLHTGVCVPGRPVIDEEGQADTETESLARALAEAAPPGGVLASSTVTEAAGPYLETSRGIVIPAPSGSGEPIASLRVLGFKAPARVNRPQLCGRAKEMSVFQRLALATEGGKTKPLILTGESGIGKSRLAEELRRFVEGRGWTVSTAREDPDAVEVPFGAIGGLVLEMLRIPRAARHQVLRETLQAKLKPVAARALVEQIAGVAPRIGRPRPGAVAAALQALEAATTKERPALLVFDDLDRIDAGSREVFRLLCDTHRPVGSLLVGLARAELKGEPWPRTATVYKVPPLPQDSSLALIRSVLGDAEIPERLADLAQPAGANPRRLLDQIHLLLDRRILVEGPKGIFLVQEPRDLPSDPAELARARIQALPADERYLLQVCALLGQAFDGQLLRRTLTGLDVPALARDAQARGLLTLGLGHGQLQFVTQEIHDALIAQIAPAEAVKLHRHLAETLRRLAAEAGAPVPEGAVAGHLAAAGDGSGAFQSFVRATSQELAARNLDAAGAWMTKAAEQAERLQPPTGPARAAECHARAAALEATAGDFPAARASLGRAQALVGSVLDPAVRSEIQLAESIVARLDGQLPEARKASQAAFAAFGGAVPTRRLALLASQAGAAALACGQPREAAQLLEEALPAVEADRMAPAFGIPDLEAQILADLGAACVQNGQIAAAAGHLDRALRRARPRRDLTLEILLLQRLAQLAERAGEAPSAASHHQAAAAAAEAAGDLETAALEYYALARLKHRDGQPQPARGFATRATDICQQIGWEEGLAMARGLFATP